MIFRECESSSRTRISEDGTHICVDCVYTEAYCRRQMIFFNFLLLLVVNSTHATETQKALRILESKSDRIREFQLDTGQSFVTSKTRILLKEWLPDCLSENYPLQLPPACVSKLRHALLSFLVTTKMPMLRYCFSKSFMHLRYFLIQATNIYQVSKGRELFLRKPVTRWVKIPQHAKNELVVMFQGYKDME